MSVLTTGFDGDILAVALNRPEAHNALHRELIAALDAAFDPASWPAGVRAVVLRGEGPSFCAGGDVGMLQEAARAGYDAALEEGLALGRMLRRVHESPVPVIAVVHGPALGGGAGLAAACDLVIAARDAGFGFPEVRLGLIPAVVSPFVLQRLTPARARRLFLTGERVSAAEAVALGLVDVLAEPETLEAELARRLESIRGNGPDAVAAAHRLVDRIHPLEWDELLALTARWLAERRVSPEGQEGMTAFLERRDPSWLQRA
jgi:enoyl-CoA hydratase/carnithine racemase